MTSINLGISSKAVKEIFGQRTLRATEIYARILDQTKFDEMRKWNRVNMLKLDLDDLDAMIQYRQAGCMEIPRWGIVGMAPEKNVSDRSSAGDVFPGNRCGCIRLGLSNRGYGSQSCCKYSLHG